MVAGICDVVPIDPKMQEEIVFRDIVVSTAMIQYDFSRQYPNGFQRKKEIEDSLGSVSPEFEQMIDLEELDWQ